MGIKEMTIRRFYPLCVGLLTAGLLAAIPTAGLAAGSFVGPFNTVSTVASTVPANGDVNPYGVAVVPRTVGRLTRGDVLVSNFNNRNNLQGTGTTIVEISPGGSRSLFAQIDARRLPGACPGGVGLTTALVALRSGWVIVGSLPTSDGTAATAKAGCLLVINSQGRVVKTLSGDGINGPWDMTAFEFDDFAALFVTNVLNGTVAAKGATVNNGTVLRIDLLLAEDRTPIELQRRVIGSGFPERTDPAALVIGPTGVGLSREGTLYVADTLANRITAIPQALFRHESAGIGRVVSTDHLLNGPLGLAIAPNGDILTVNSGDGNLVETTPQGAEVAVKTLDTSGTPPGAGTLFGLAVIPGGRGVYFVDDGTNTLNTLS
jgi:hypothetical protein